MAQVKNNTAVKIVARYIKALDNANPDIGWGKSWRTCVDEALVELGLTSADISPSVYEGDRR